MTTQLRQILKYVRLHPRYFEAVARKRIRINWRSRWVQKNRPHNLISPPPFVYSVQLTTRCNLRCRYCMEWGESGWLKKSTESLRPLELDWASLQRLIESTAPQKPFFLFWGGEPFLYSHIPELLQVLDGRGITASFCTNGTLLSQYREFFFTNPRIALVVSIDGFCPQMDSARGKGTFDLVVDQLHTLRDNARRRPYIGIEFTVLPENVAVMRNFCSFASELKVDWVVFNLRWFNSPQQAKHYKQLMSRRYGLDAKSQEAYISDYPLDREEFKRQFAEINGRSWPISISWQPNLRNVDAIDRYIDAPEKPASGSSLCYKQWMRMDILADGSVTTCKMYPDFKVGNLTNTSSDAIWNSLLFQQFRRDLQKSRLPVCSKCEALSWYDPKRTA